MDIFTIEVTADLAGTRLDSFLTSQLQEISRAYLQKLISDNLILVNEQNKKANYKVKEGDVILVQIPEAAPIDVLPEEMDLDIVYEDSDVIVINKPVGLVVHPAHGHYSGTLVNGLLAHCKDLSGINGKMRPGIVHRIDKDTSGLIMVAKNDAAHQHLAAQLKEHSITRAYYALVQGVISEPAGLVDAPIGRHGTDRKKMAVTFNNSKEARTKYVVKERFARNTFVECRLETGRTHQIRVHMAYLGHPLVGDPLYGTRKNNLDFPGQALHAYQLGFVHPRTGENLLFEAPLPEHYQAVLHQLALGG
ncbi:MAG: RluA family pseudouridine synthase [Peptococcaceae bacterium]|nr:RluA family pseudouridine synthase [Peptococcaceae bacterium]